MKRTINNSFMKRTMKNIMNNSFIKRTMNNSLTKRTMNCIRNQCTVPRAARRMNPTFFFDTGVFVLDTCVQLCNVMFSCVT